MLTDIPYAYDLSTTADSITNAMCLLHHFENSSTDFGLGKNANVSKTK